MAGRIALGLIAVWLIVQATMWVGHQQKIAGCVDAWRVNSSYWQYDDRCSGVSASELDDVVRRR
jgi:hypothetical protein